MAYNPGMAYVPGVQMVPSESKEELLSSEDDGTVASSSKGSQGDKKGKYKKVAAGSVTAVVLGGIAAFATHSLTSTVDRGILFEAPEAPPCEEDIDAAKACLVHKDDKHACNSAIGCHWGECSCDLSSDEILCTDVTKLDLCSMVSGSMHHGCMPDDSCKPYSGDFDCSTLSSATECSEAFSKHNTICVWGGTSCLSTDSSFACGQITDKSMCMGDKTNKLFGVACNWGGSSCLPYLGTSCEQITDSSICSFAKAKFGKDCAWEATTCARPPYAPLNTKCPHRPTYPPPNPDPLHYNGVSWPEMCFEGDIEEHVFLMGDWGALEKKELWGSKTAPAYNINGRKFVRHIDGNAQELVAKALQQRAVAKHPRFILNAGDNFYWGGIGAPQCKETCGKPMNQTLLDWTNKDAPNNRMFYNVFDNMYKGPGIDGRYWLSVLGNHDYGGVMFNAAWDQQIWYTWKENSRWVMPALYFHQYVKYPTINVTMDIYLLDSNNQDTAHWTEDPNHNICGSKNSKSATCPYGPPNLWNCAKWFRGLWMEQMEWLDNALNKSTADWQIVVTHFPPDPPGWSLWPGHHADWRRLGNKHGIDAVVASHRHQTEFHDKNHWYTKKGGRIPYIVVGGGGGVSAQKDPSIDSSQYGFVDMTVGKDALRFDMIGFRGRVLKSMTLEKRFPSP